jgi:hypothetical protein
VLATRPPAGFHHPLDVPGVRAVLDALGPLATYGLRSVELAGPPGTGLALGRLVVPGRVLLFAQPHPPWVLPGRLGQADRDRLEAAGALVTEGAGRVAVNWPGGNPPPPVRPRRPPARAGPPRPPARAHPHPGHQAGAAHQRPRSRRRAAGRPLAPGARVTLLLVGDGIGNPHNARALVDAAALLGAGCGFRDRGGRLAAALGAIPEVTLADLDGRRVVAMETAPGAAELYARRLAEPARAAVVVGNERRGIAPGLLARADETVALPMPGGLGSINVAAAAGVALWYLARGPGQAVVIPDGDGSDWARLGRTVVVAGLGCEPGPARYRLVASIAVAEVARQLGRARRPARSRPGRRPPAYGRGLTLEPVGELVDPAELAAY